MKKVIIVLLYMLLIPDICSQGEWFPIGAEWYYEWRNTIAPVLKRHYVVEKDTLVNGKSCRLIRSKNNLLE